MNPFKYLLPAAVLVFWGCAQEDLDFDGPELGHVSDSYSLESGFSATSTEIDFQTTDSLFFTFSGSERASYTIQLTGLTSGASQTLTGIGQNVHQGWNGSSELIFFQAEEVACELSILGKEEVYYDTITITNPYTPEGVQLASFERGKTWASCWFPGNNEIECRRQGPAIEGEFGHTLTGISKDKPGDLFVGLASIDPRIGLNNNGKNFAVPTTDPDSLYFNIFIYGEGDDNVAMFIKFMQDDNDNGSHESDRENGYEMQLLDLSHTGWKKFSFKYSDVPLGGNSNFGGNGDGIQRPDQIIKVELGLWAMKDPSKEVSFIYDYAVFTAGKPFGAQ